MSRGVVRNVVGSARERYQPRSMPRRPRTSAASSAPPPAAEVTEPDFRAVLESLGDVVYTLDLDGRFTYLNARAFEVFGYDREEGRRFLGSEFMELLAPGAAATAVAAIRHRAEFPQDRQVFRIEARHKDGTPIALEVHGGPIWQDGRVVGRVGVCRVLAETDRDESVGSRSSRATDLQEERMRIARGLRDAIAQIVFGVTAERDASESFLADVKRATQADLARRLRLDEVDLEILRLVAGGASNREIGTQVHLSPAAIKDRIRRLMDRLGVRRRAELAAHALRLGIA
jgi:PAS domain S-box-containing protein